MHGNLKVDMGTLANKLHDPYEKHVELGVVFKPDSGEHYTIEQTDGKNTDVYVECQLVPTQTEVTARLCCIGESGGTGIYKIPPPGTEVILVFPGGTLDAVPYIVASGNTVSQDGPNSGKGVPDELDADTMVISNTKATIICNNSGDITINAKDGKVIVNASSQVELAVGGAGGTKLTVTSSAVDVT
jgi:phage gp45-like